MPYSLSKAVAYLKENKLLKVKDYLNFLRNNKDKQPETILLLEILEKSSLAWLILQYSACLDPDFISIDIFKELFLLDEEKLQEPIEKLEALSLMKLIYQDGQAGLQLHGLVQATVQRCINKQLEYTLDKKEIYTRLIETLDYLFPGVISEPNKDWEIAKLIYPHILKILNDDNRDDKLTKASLYQKAGYYNDHILCKFENSLQYHEKAIKIFQKLYQGNHPFITYSLNDIGLAYYKIGKFENSLKYFEETLKIRQELYPGNHPDIAESLNNIGLVYRTLGEFNKGLSYLEAALRIREIFYKSNNPYIADSLNNVGLAYKDLGRIFEGLKYFEAALEMTQKLYPGNHPKVAGFLSNVGVAYKDLGRVSKGLEYLKEALKMRLALYQDNHPDIADSLSNIGLAYDKLGYNEKGLVYLKAALDVRKAFHQGNHPSIAALLNNVGLIYSKLGDNKKELKYLEEALKMNKASYQESYYDIAEAIVNIGVAYEQSGDKNKAVKYYTQAYLMRVQTSGINHPHTKELKNYLEKNAPEFIKNNETREFILQRGDFEEITLEVKQKIQKEVLDKIYINAAKGKWKSGKFFIRFLGNWSVKGYLCDKYLAKQLKDLSNAKNIEIAKMLCFEAICLGAINHPNKDFICAIEFTKAYPELAEKITTEHPEYFIDGSILRACINDEAILSKLLHPLNSNV